MNCKTCRSRMEEWLDGAMPPRQAAQLERHLAACPQCAGYLEERQALARSLRLAATAATTHLRYTPMDLSSAATVPARTHASNWRYALAAAAACLVLAVGLWLGLGSGGGSAMLPEGVTAVILVEDDRSNREDAFISGRESGRRYHIHLQVVVKNNEGQPG
jgi:predicted anti-sigma-YlaC factor YlaD